MQLFKSYNTRMLLNKYIEELKNSLKIVFFNDNQIPTLTIKFMSKYFEYDWTFFLPEHINSFCVTAMFATCNWCEKCKS